jgi:hypothetical protein
MSRNDLHLELEEYCTNNDSTKHNFQFYNQALVQKVIGIILTENVCLQDGSSDILLALRIK